MSNPAEQKIQLQLIKDILRTHTHLPKTRSFSDIPLKRGATRIFERLSNIYTIIEELKVFSDCFSKDTFDSFESGTNGRLFVLKEIRRESHILPVVGIKYKIGENNLSISLRAGLYQNNKGENNVEKLVAFGYRFESPSKDDHQDSENGEKIKIAPQKKEAPVVAALAIPSPQNSINNSVSSHDFFHAQPIQTFKKDDKRFRLPGCPEWFTEKQPSFPLDAKCPVTLTLAFLVGLYGGTCWDEIGSDRNLLRRVKIVTKGLHFAPIKDSN